MKKLIFILGLFISIISFSQIQTISVGSAPNDGTGDNLRNAFIKVNNNDSYLNGTKMDTTDVLDRITDTASSIRAQLRSDIADTSDIIESQLRGDIADTADILRDEWRNDISDSITLKAKAYDTIRVDSVSTVGKTNGGLAYANGDRMGISDDIIKTDTGLIIDNNAYINDTTFFDLTNKVYNYYYASGNVLKITNNISGGDIHIIANDDFYIQNGGSNSMFVGGSTIYSYRPHLFYGSSNYLQSGATLYFRNSSNADKGYIYGSSNLLIGGSFTGNINITDTADFDYNVNIDSNLVVGKEIFVTGGYRGEGVRHIRGAFNDSSVAMTTIQNNWYQVTNANYDLWTYIETDEFSTSNDTISYNMPGISNAHYNWTCILTIQGVNGDNYELRFYNVTDDTQLFGIKGEGSVDASGFNVQLICEMYDTDADDGDEIVIQVRNTEDNDGPTLIGGYIKGDYNHE